MHIKLLFRVNAVKGQDALTQFVGHDMTSDYIRRLTRRKRTRTDLTVDVVTKDHWNVRVKPMAITDRRIQTSKQRVIRTIMAKLVADVAAKQSIGEFVKGVISGDLAKTIAQGCKPIHPVSRLARSEEHTSELQSHHDLVCRLLLEKKKRRRGENRGLLSSRGEMAFPRRQSRFAR